MKASHVVILFAMLSAAGYAADNEGAPLLARDPEGPSAPGYAGPAYDSVRIGDASYISQPGGKTDYLLRNGNVVIFQQNGISVFSPTERGRTPQFIQDSTGRVVGPTKAAEAPAIIQRPNPAAIRPNAPSPAMTPSRPGYSTMPSSPFLRANPLRR